MERALALAPNLGEAHATRGWLSLLEWQWEESEAAFRRALELNPGSAYGHGSYGELFMALGRVPEGVEALERAAELDPFSAWIAGELGWALFVAGRHAEALVQLARAEELGWSTPLYRFRIHRDLGRDSTAADALLRLHEAWRITEPSAGELRAAFASEGLRGVLRRLVRVWPVPVDDDAVLHAYLEMSLGDAEEALRLLERAVEDRDRRVYWIGVQPEFRPLHDDPRFWRLLARMGLDPEEILDAAARPAGAAPPGGR